MPVIDPRFNGPADSGNGGYSCGVVAELLGASAATVTLRLPPPLDRELTVTRDEGRVELHDGDRLVAEGVAGTSAARAASADRPLPASDGPTRRSGSEHSAAGPSDSGPAHDAGVEHSASASAVLPSTDPVSPDAAAAAVRAGKDEWATDHPFPTCFVCGPARPRADGLSIFPSPLGDGRYAALWTPAAEFADDDGIVDRRYVWAALDCPTAAPCMNPASEPPVVLARLEARIDAPVRAGEPHVIVSWPIDRDGRKRRAGAALLDAAGNRLATSEALWIELRPG